MTPPTIKYISFKMIDEVSGNFKKMMNNIASMQVQAPVNFKGQTTSSKVADAAGLSQNELKKISAIEQPTSLLVSSRLKLRELENKLAEYIKAEINVVHDKQKLLSQELQLRQSIQKRQKALLRQTGNLKTLKQKAENTNKDTSASPQQKTKINNRVAKQQNLLTKTSNIISKDKSTLQDVSKTLSQNVKAQQQVTNKRIQIADLVNKQRTQGAVYKKNLQNAVNSQKGFGQRIKDLANSGRAVNQMLVNIGLTAGLAVTALVVAANAYKAMFGVTYEIDQNTGKLKQKVMSAQQRFAQFGKSIPILGDIASTMADAILAASGQASPELLQQSANKVNEINKRRSAAIKQFNKNLRDGMQQAISEFQRSDLPQELAGLAAPLQQLAKKFRDIDEIEELNKGTDGAGNLIKKLQAKRVQLQKQFLKIQQFQNSLAKLPINAQNNEIRQKGAQYVKQVKTSLKQVAFVINRSIEDVQPYDEQGIQNRFNFIKKLTASFNSVALKQAIEKSARDGQKKQFQLNKQLSDFKIIDVSAVQAVNNKYLEDLRNIQKLQLDAEKDGVKLNQQVLKQKKLDAQTQKNRSLEDLKKINNKQLLDLQNETARINQKSASARFTPLKLQQINKQFEDAGKDIVLTYTETVQALTFQINKLQTDINRGIAPQNAKSQLQQLQDKQAELTRLKIAQQQEIADKQKYNTKQFYKTMAKSLQDLSSKSFQLNEQSALQTALKPFTLSQLDTLIDIKKQAQALGFDVKELIRITKQRQGILK